MAGPKPTLRKAAPGRSKSQAAKAKTGETPEGIAALKNRREKVTVAVPVPPRRPGFPVVGIGASAGGLDALVELFDNMPADTGMAFVVVTHQHPGHTSLLPELLGRQTGMTVAEATDGTVVKPNRVYVGPPGAYLAMVHGTLRLARNKEGTLRLPIDYFFRSLANDQKERAICIVLSGTATDGTLGLKAIKGESGMAIVQQPQSAKYSGMPDSAIATGAADYVLPPALMPRQLVAYAKGPYLMGAPLGGEIPPIGDELAKVFALLRVRTGNDFTGYKDNTIRRRIERRMNVHQITKANDYVRYLQENPHEIDILFKELLIGVTNFFRDPDAWISLGKYLEELIQSRPEKRALRVWVPGCATGEEVFSLAILLRECMDKLSRHLPLQIFGTDLDAESIETARAGLYPGGIAVDISPERLSRYFTREDGSYRVRKEIRETTVFAPQNLIKQPPFTKIDLISCRNLLIYLGNDLHRKLMPIFHYALKPGGLLFLGPSESTGSSTELFEALDKRWKIFRRKESALPYGLPQIPAQPATGDEPLLLPAMPELTTKHTHVLTQIQRTLLNWFAPATVVVNDRGDIHYIHGRTGAYLEPAPGAPLNNVLEMARDGLKFELSSAMRECTRKDASITREGIRVKSNGGFVEVNLTVARIHEPEALRGLMLVSFYPAPKLTGKSKQKKTRKPPRDSGRVELLERELLHLKESQQTTLEELETSNEELKSSNEELQSTNEELQSTNEEMETSKEEMQSLNEELTTVNTELQSKVELLSQTNDDMQNLLNSTDIATVFLDNNLNVKRFTDKVTDLVTLRLTDVGRPISDLTSNLEYDGLADDCREVLKTLSLKQSEVRTNDGRWYLMRIMPYRTSENIIDGLVLTFVNIGQLMQAVEAGKRTSDYFEAIVDAVREPLLVLNNELRVVSANRAFYHLFHTTPKQTEGKGIYELAAGQWDVPKLRELLEGILPRNAKFDDFEVKVTLPKVGARVFALNARRLHQVPGTTGDLILLALEDMTNR